ncbi:hypothetical protein [Paraburkholderia aspalathi]|uniref:hypothetical protein n=1 Tax=Paraburkholderia aspalathi TaxID=1324617 RepID=UPI0038BCAE0D
MKTHRNAEQLIGYLREQRQPVTVTRVATAGVMNRRDAFNAMQYGVRHGVIERVKVPGARVSARVLYQLTGQQLPVPGKEQSGPTFDALLAAWGIARVPPQLPGDVSKRVALTD